MVYFWIKKKKKRKKEKWHTSLFFFSKRQSVDTFFVPASYDRLSVTIIIDGNSKDTKGRYASPGQGVAKEKMKERKKERKKR